MSMTQPLKGKVDFGWILESFNLFKEDSGLWIGAILAFGVFGVLVIALADIVFPGAPAPAGVLPTRAVAARRQMPHGASNKTAGRLA